MDLGVGDRASGLGVKNRGSPLPIIGLWVHFGYQKPQIRTTWTIGDL